MKTTFLLFVIAFVLVGCIGTSAKADSRSSSTTNNYSISYDSIKIKFEKGDRIVINGWLLLGPKTFFDSVSIDTTLFVGYLVSMDSIKTKYKSWANSRNVYEIQIPDMDLLPYGDFLDVQACEYLVPNEDIFYFLDGGPCEGYFNLIQNIKNYKIANIQSVDGIGAIKIWGPKYGKDGAIIIDVNRSMHAQSMFRPFDPSNIFRRIIKIDSAEFYSKKVNFRRIDKPTTIRKGKGIITIPTDSSVVRFHDNPSDDNFMEYSVVGQDVKKGWVLIVSQPPISWTQNMCSHR